jgi:hypothetical protein
MSNSTLQSTAASGSYSVTNSSKNRSGQVLKHYLVGSTAKLFDHNQPETQQHSIASINIYN